VTGSITVLQLKTQVLAGIGNPTLNMPHLWGRWMILAKEKCSLTQI